MDDAKKCGCFADLTSFGMVQAPAQVAKREEIMDFSCWHQELLEFVQHEESYVPPKPPSMPNTSGFHTQPSSDENVMLPVAARPLRAVLNKNQRIAHTIIENHVLAQQHGRRPEQLLMLVLSAGGTGKTLLLNAIAETFRHHGTSQQLGLTATSGIAATLFGGSMIHSWAGIAVNSSLDKPSRAIAAKRQAHMVNNQLLVIDEISMLEKALLCKLSDSAIVT